MVGRDDLIAPPTGRVTRPRVTVKRGAALVHTARIFDIILSLSGIELRGSGGRNGSRC